MTRRMTAAAWARSLAARYRAHARRLPRLNLVLLQPTVVSAPVNVVQHKPSYVTRHSTYHTVRQTSYRIALHVAPRVAIAIQTGRAPLVAPTRLVSHRAARDAQDPRPATVRVIKRRPTVDGAAGSAGLKRYVNRSDVDGSTDAPTRFTPVRRLVRAPAGRSPDDSHGAPPWSEHNAPSVPTAVWPERTPGSPPPGRTWPHDEPAIDIDRVTDQVVRAIDRRAIAYRERQGRV
jgi:hypothetical protein